MFGIISSLIKGIFGIINYSILGGSIILVCAILTKPNKESYKKYFKDNFKIIDNKTIAGKILNKVIGESTDYFDLMNHNFNDYIIFTTARTDIPEGSNITFDGIKINVKQMSFVGIFGSWWYVNNLLEIKKE